MIGGPSIIYERTNGEVVAQINDQSIEVCVLSQPFTKPELEHAQLEHFQKKVANTSKWAFNIEEAGDRPDFWIQRGEQRIGLDVAAFASTERRRATDQFRKLKLILADAHSKGRLRSCAGIEVQLSFPTGQVPKEKQFDQSAEELITSLETYVIDHKVWQEITGDEFLHGKNPFPLGESGSSSDGLMNWHVSGKIRSQNFFSRNCGFTIEHQYVETVTAATVKVEIDRVIGSHDVPGQNIEELVLVAGGPDVFGQAVAGESTIAHLYFGDWKGSITPPSCLSRVFIDNWLLDTPILIFDRGSGFIANP